MLVAISDLHFEEEQEDLVSSPDCPPVCFQRNIPAAAFARVFSHLAELARRANADDLHLVLAGDIFDLHRTALWFSPQLKALCPYVSCADVAAKPAMEAAVLFVLRRIAAEPEVAATLGLLKALLQGRYRNSPEDPDSEEDFPAKVHLHYLPGNHDRLANATPGIRQEVRSLFGLPQSPAPFDNSFTLTDPRVLVRHGHEYDRFNFSENYEDTSPLPEAIPASQYDSPAFGDFITVEVAARLPYQFRQTYTPTDICRKPALGVLYKGLLAFDDVRPQSALLDYLLSETDSATSRSELWKLLRPVVNTVLEDVHDHPFLHAWLPRLGKRAVGLALKTGAWKLGLDLLPRFGSMFATAGASQLPQVLASREPALLSGQVRFVVAGHTHDPQVAFVNGDTSFDRFYVDTGTWRRRLLAGGRPLRFGNLKSLTYVTVYASCEDRSRTRPVKTESFDYLSGYTERWL